MAAKNRGHQKMPQTWRDSRVNPNQLRRRQMIALGHFDDSHSNSSDKERARQKQAGQIVVEYILLLVVAVSIAILITRVMIGREDGNEGFVIQAWQSLIEQIGSDKPDDLNKTN